MNTTKMTQSAYARYRGCDRSHISRLVKAGKIRVADGLVDVDVADHSLGPPLRRVSPLQPSSTSVESRPEQPLELISGGKPPAYASSRAWREYYAAAEARLDCEERSGELIPANQIEEFLATMFSHVRQGILTLPSRAAPKVHDAKTIPEIERILNDYCREVLEELAGAEYHFTPTDEGLPS